MIKNILCYTLVLALVSLGTYPALAKPPTDTSPYYEKTYDNSPDSFKPLSPSTGWILGFSPLSGDGLIYTGHPYWGGSLMAGELLLGLPLLLAGLSEQNDKNSFLDLSGFLIGLGSGIMAGTYVIDALATPILVHSHNKALKSPAKRVTPFVTYDGKNFQGGFQMSFK